MVWYVAAFLVLLEVGFVAGEVVVSFVVLMLIDDCHELRCLWHSVFRGRGDCCWLIVVYCQLVLIQLEFVVL